MCETTAHRSDFFITAINASVYHVALSVSAAYVAIFFIFAAIWWLVVQYVCFLSTADPPCTHD